MKTLCVLLVIFCVERCTCFLSYPISSHVLNEFLTALKANEKSEGSELMKHAVPGANCVRKCVRNDHKVCYFNFTLKHYQTLGGSCNDCSKGNIDNCLDDSCVIADGIGRGFLSLNFKLPGPKIQVCKDDIIVVDLYNEAEGLSTSIHWHGLRQFGTQFMDGVPFLTQCPIPFGESFRYSFYASDEGTHFYHSHSGSQKVDGVFGALVVRGVDEDNPNRHIYDHDLPDHTIIMADWMHQMADDHMPGFTKRSVLSQSVLINGHGRFFNQTTNSSTFAPLAIFYVEPGMKYRFRVINAGLNVCPFIMQIEDHNLTLIATEVSYVRPQVFHTLNFLSGERYDFVIDTSHLPARDYWIRFKQLNPCYQKLEGFAILRYHDKEHRTSKKNLIEFNSRVPPSFAQEYPNGTYLNSPFPFKDHMSITKLEDFRYDPKITEGPADKTEYLFFDTPSIFNKDLYHGSLMKRFMFITSTTGESFIATVNNISFLYPTFPLLLEPEHVHEKLFCDANTVKAEECAQFGTKNLCKCLHRIKFKLGSIAELIVVNIDDKLGHPMHLHGHKFHIMDMGLLPENITYSEVKNGALPASNPKRPPYKDTVLLPYPGYIRLRFRANNPGYWLFHCHFDWHLPIGMAVLVQVGEVEEMRKPPENFPRCHSYLPDDIV